MGFLAMIVVASGILMAQLLATTIREEALDYDLRIWIYRHYGSASRSVYTIFEATLSGGWPNYARRLVEDVSAWYAVFWMIYVVTVVFAIIRVMSPLFLTTTMRAAGEDEDMMVLR